MLLLRDIGRMVANARADRRLTQQALAERAGISRATLDALENGRLAELGFVKMSRVCSELGLRFELSNLPEGRPTLRQIWAEDADD